MNEKLLTTKQAARYLNVSLSMLAKDRMNKAEIPYIRIRTRTIRYRVTDLDKFIEANSQT